MVDLVENDFEGTVIRMAPVIGEGLTLAREVFPRGTALTGSGSVFFSLVGDTQEGIAEALSVRLTSLGIRTYLASLNFL
jgi:4-diphosphocytidyl-2C-methyl-D-erythritol kinase